jgi:hypothetical protein
MSFMTRIWVDFNDRTEEDLVPANVRDSDGEVGVGDRVVAYDGEGNEAPASVANVLVRQVDLLVEWDGFTRAEQTQDQTHNLA